MRKGENTSLHLQLFFFFFFNEEYMHISKKNRQGRNVGRKRPPAHSPPPGWAAWPRLRSTAPHAGQREFMYSQLRGPEVRAQGSRRGPGRFLLNRPEGYLGASAGTRSSRSLAQGRARRRPRRAPACGSATPVTDRGVPPVRVSAPPFPLRSSSSHAGFGAALLHRDLVSI